MGSLEVMVVNTVMPPILLGLASDWYWLTELASFLDSDALSALLDCLPSLLCLDLRWKLAILR